MSILAIVVIIIVGLITYMHYLQGLLTGLISFVLALIAMSMAFSYYEPLAETLSGGKFNDTAQGICLLAIFALIYLIGRVLFDKFVPGNVRVPFLADKIGGAVMGLFAGMIAMGMVVIALQTMPFGPSIAGYQRFPLAPDTEKAVAFATAKGNRGLDRTIYDETKNNDLDKDETGLMLMPVDDLVVGIAKRLSSEGSLATGHPFAQIHPNLLQELYGQRIGIEVGAKHTASNVKDAQVSVEQINVLPKTMARMTPEFPEIWSDAPKGTLGAEPGKMLMSVTIMFGKDSSDEGNITRVSPGSIRLCVPKNDEATEWTNCFPIGTVQDGKCWNNRIDDFIFIDLREENRGAHFIFQVDTSALTETRTVSAKPTAGGKSDVTVTYSMKDGCFLEVKRLAKIPLDGVKVVVGVMPPEEKKYYPMRKTAFYDLKSQTASTGTPTPPVPTPTTPTPTTPTPTTPAPTTPGPSSPWVSWLSGGKSTPTAPTPTTPTTPTPPTPPNPGDNGWAEATLDSPVLSVSNQLPVGIGVGAADVANVLAAGASGHLTAKQFDQLDVDPSNEAAGLSELPKAGNPIQALSVPAGKRMLQITMSFKAGTDPWAWAPNLGNYSVVDGAGTAYKPSGVIGAATAGRAQRLLAVYKSTGDVTVKKIDGVALRSITLLFVVPTDQKATELRYQGKAGGLPLEK